MTVFRYHYFGAVALVCAAANHSRFLSLFRSLTRRQWGVVLFLNFAGLWGYTYLLMLGIEKSGSVVGALIIGLLPITIPVTEKVVLTGKVRMTRLGLLGLFLILLGLVILFSDRSSRPGATAGTSPVFGVLILVLALALWTAYAVSATAFLTSLSSEQMGSYNDLSGLVCWAFVIPLSLLPAGPLSVSYPTIFSGGRQMWLFLAGTAVLGVGSTWGAYKCWSACSRRLSSAVSGPLAVVETVSALILSFLVDARLPTPGEALTIALFSIGAGLAISEEVKEQRKQQQKQEQPAQAKDEIALGDDEPSRKEDQ